MAGGFERGLACGVFAAVVWGATTLGHAANLQLDLRGSEWGFAEETIDPQRSVQFDGDGRVSGSGGCNRFWARSSSRTTGLGSVSSCRR